jgi:hypothetical protein
MADLMQAQSRRRRLLAALGAKTPLRRERGRAVLAGVTVVDCSVDELIRCGLPGISDAPLS